MSEDYLWDGSGEPDPEVQRLERLLGRLRHTRPAPEFPAPPVRFPRTRALFPRLALAAAAVLLIAVAWQVLRRSEPAQEAARLEGGPDYTGQTGRQPATESARQPGPQKAAWEVARLEGAPKVGPDRIAGTGRLTVGDWLETDGVSRARIAVGIIGQVQVEPNTRVRLVETRLTGHRLSLARGTIHAMIWAPPRLFFVETPSAVAVDLGCAYTLKVDETGAGLVRVTSGWVGFEAEGRESFIPAGALCATRPGIGPGTPYFEDAPEPLKAALVKLDFEQGDPAAQVIALKVILAKTRRRDALTLWHLLSRAHETGRGPVYDGLTALVPPPKGVTRDGILAGDRRMIERWWDELGLGDTKWWRLWKSPWPPRSR